MAARVRVVLGRRWQGWVLALIEAFVAYQAISGGIGLISDTWELPTQWLERTPFDSWTGPGWILIGLVAVPQLLAIIPQLFVARRPSRGVLAGLLAGTNLLIWIGLQLVVLQVYFFLQPVIAGIGVVEIVLALWWQRSERRSAEVSSR